jgi:predicted amidohydrolase
MSTLLITTIQTDLYWEDKQSNLQMLEEKIRGMREDAEIVILPEMFSTGFSMRPELLAESMDGVTVNWMKRMAALKKIVLVGSVIIEERTDTHSFYYNRLLWVLPNGTHGYYDKRHRFAFAQEDEFYTAGNKRLIASINGWRINLLVCYDLRFPVWARQQSDSNSGELEYDVLVYVANWPEKRIHAWKTLLQARAIENQCYVVGVNRVGDDGKGIHYNGETLVADPL